MILDPAGPPLKAAAIKNTIPGERSGERADAGERWGCCEVGVTSQKMQAPRNGKRQRHVFSPELREQTFVLLKPLCWSFVMATGSEHTTLSYPVCCKGHGSQ